MTQRRLTKKQKRQVQRQQSSINSGLEIKRIDPLTDNQELAFSFNRSNKNLMLHGIAGTGKTFLAMYFALKEILEGDTNKKKLVIVRSVVPTRDMGFLPGTAKEKAAVYEAPYIAICTELFGRGDAYELLSRKGIIEFISTSFIRGITLSDSVVIVDEAENLNGHELDSIITRLGYNTRILFSGDFRQTDLTNNREKKGFSDFINILKHMDLFAFIDFKKEDIVRSELVKSYIIAKDELNIVL